MSRRMTPYAGWDSDYAFAIDQEHGPERVRRVSGGAPGNAYAVSQTTIGLAKETIKGTPVAPAFWFKVKAPKYKPDLTLIEDDTLQGSMVKVYETIPGLRYDSHGWDSFLYMDVMPLLAMGELGSADTTTTLQTSTTITGATTAGATSITTGAALTTGKFIVIDTGGLLETNYVVTGGTTSTLLFPLNYNHGAACPVAGITGHAFSLLNNAGATGNQPPGLTITDFDGEEWRQLSAGQVDKLTVKGNATGLAEYSTTFFANPSTTPANPTPAFTALEAAPGWTAMLLIGGVDKNYVVDWQIDMARQVKPIPALTGTQAYFAYFADAMINTGKITLIEQSGSSDLAAFEAGTTESLDILVYDKVSGDCMYLHSSKARYKTGEIDRSKAWVEVPLTIDLLPTATDAASGGVSPLKLQFGNGQTTAY